MTSISSDNNKSRVSPFFQELLKLLTHESTRHHHINIMNVRWIMVRVHVQIHNYKFGNYNEMEEGFIGVDEGDGDGDDGDGCIGLPNRSGEYGGSLLRFPLPEVRFSGLFSRWMLLCSSDWKSEATLLKYLARPTAWRQYGWRHGWE